MGEVKVFAMYLPQYYETEYNSRFWGKGFTDWVSVKKAVPFFKGHEQPQVPLENNYYDLSNPNSIRAQVKMAQRYHVSGWGIYHYWFNDNEQALTKPAEIILENKDIDIPFFFAWDNASWKRTWSKIKGNDWAPAYDGKIDEGRSDESLLIEYQVGNKDSWKKHYKYLLPFFKDSRYEKDNGKPIFIIFNYSLEIKKMVECWNEWSIKDGFKGIEIIYSYNPLHHIPRNAYKFTYEPLYSGWGSFWDRAKRLLHIEGKKDEISFISYKKIWINILRNAAFCIDKKRYYGALVSYDDTPRRGKRGRVVTGSSPEMFEIYLSKLINICARKKKKYIFLTAWNEWGESAHLEPDELNQYAYLEAYSKALKSQIDTK